MDRLRRDPNPEACGRCRGAGWIMTEKEGVEVAVPCPQCSAENKRRRLLSHAEIPPRYGRMAFNNFQPLNDSQRRALFALKSFAEKYPLDAKGTLLIGPTGIGKTHLAIATLNYLLREKLISCRFVDEKVLLRDLQYSYGPDATSTQREIMQPLSEVDVLVWDDLGASRGTQWARETIDTILNSRYLNNKPTILTTNVPIRPVRRQPEESIAERPKASENLIDRIGQRLFSRMNEMCRVLHVKGQDHRQVQAAGLGVGGGPAAPAIACPECGHEPMKESSRANGENGSVELYLHCIACESNVRARVRDGRVHFED